MNDEERLAELLLAWEEFFEQGHANLMFLFSRFRSIEDRRG